MENQVDQNELQRMFELQFRWSEVDEASEERETLLKDFGEDMAAVNRRNDLEEGMLAGLNSADRTAYIRHPGGLSRSDREIADRQPEGHKKNKSLLETLMGICCCGARQKDLNKRETKFWKKFKDQMIKPYSHEDPLHEHNLEMLFKMVFKREDLVSEDNQNNLTLINDLWKDIGFQGRNPRTDFRGGGYLSLVCLIYFAKNYPKEFEQLAKLSKEREDLMWLTAISSINVTHHLVIYLYMNDGDVPGTHTKIRAGREQFKNFCKLNWQSKLAFYELNSFGLRFVFRQWLKMIKSSGGDPTKIMGSFNSCIDATKARIQSLLLISPGDIEAFINKCDAAIAKFDSENPALLEGI